MSKSKRVAGWLIRELVVVVVKEHGSTSIGAKISLCVRILWIARIGGWAEMLLPRRML